MKRIISDIVVFIGAIGIGIGVFQSQEVKQITSIVDQTFNKSSDEEDDLLNQIEVKNQNKPTFFSKDLTLEKGNWQVFSDLDSLNRVGEANAMLHKSMMPTEERERLYIKPTGWKQKKMKNGDYLYNRCHLIGYQLTGENNNPRNLMTGTRSFNTPAMVEYENKVAEYLRKTGNHVRYRVRPDFRGNELVARGVQMEAQSIEDNRISFNVYIHNTQEGYVIDYQTGNSRVQN
ncbi:DNA/RNA non-specific endonuclease [Enterococcus hirae]|nr:DNA/RNA non-specific endonuclease [Enterococcus hirae]